MADVERIDYKPAPTVKEFIKYHIPGKLFYSWIVGPVGSGKTSGNFFKLAYMAGLQEPGPDGVRRTRAVVVRNTAPQLKDTTIKSWDLWFKNGQAGEWMATDKVFWLRFMKGNTLVECEVMFRALDTPDDIARVLSLEVTFVIVDEFVEIHRTIIDALSGRAGRYPNKKLGGATNYGLWGSSNTDTEDNWWFEYLHGANVDRFVNQAYEPVSVREHRRSMARIQVDGQSNTTYFLQPSGFADNAENLENLAPYEPGNHQYYLERAENKKKEWIKQFIDAEWGYSIAGKPVVPTFDSATHVAKKALIYNPLLPLIVGYDPGVTYCALIFGQQTSWGRLNVLGELVLTGYGTKRMLVEQFKPYVVRRFHGARIIFAPDPASNNRTQNDERTVVDEIKRHYEVKVETNNRFPLRIDAIEHFTTTRAEEGSLLQIDPFACPVLIRALKGGWRFGMDVKKEIPKGAEPEKNMYSHPGDAFGYLARYFHRLTEREQRWGSRALVSSGRFVPPRFSSKSYHVR